MDTFESLMRKKLGGKYVKPSFIDDEAKLDDKTNLTTRTPWTKSLVKMVIKRTEKKVAS